MTSLRDTAKKMKLSKPNLWGTRAIICALRYTQRSTGVDDMTRTPRLTSYRFSWVQGGHVCGGRFDGDLYYGRLIPVTCTSAGGKLRDLDPMAALDRPGWT